MSAPRRRLPAADLAWLAAIAAVPLTTTLRILGDMMSTSSDPAIWNATVERVRQGGAEIACFADAEIQRTRIADAFGGGASQISISYS